MSYRRHLYELKTTDLLLIDASYYRGPNGAKLAQGKFFYCTRNPKLQLVFFDRGNYYINSAASVLAGDAVIRALKKRFPKLKLEEKSIRTGASDTESVIPANYTPDPTTANITPIEKTVKNWLIIRFYRLDANRKKEYLEGVPYSITDKYQPADTRIFEQGKSPAGGTLEYDNMPSDDFYTVHYGLPGSGKYTEKELVSLRMVNELKVEEIKVTAKIAAEYKVVLLDKKLSRHQKSTEEKIVPDGTAVELWLEQDPGSPVFDQGAKIEVSGAGTIDAFLDKEMTKKLNIGDLIPKDKITGGKKLKVWLKGTEAGKFTLKLTPAKSSNGKFVIQPPAEMEMGIVELKMEIYEQDIAKIKSIQVDPDQEPISNYHADLAAQVLPDQIVLSDEDKVKKGRLLHMQKNANFGRSKVIIKALTADQFPSGCDDYEFMLNSGGKSGKLKLFSAEFDGTEIKLPLKLKKGDLTTDKTYWVEGASESNALRDTVLDMGMDRPKGGMAKRPKRNGDWGRYSIVRIDTVELDYTQPAGGPNAWDSAKKRFFINMQKGNAGRKITIKAKLSKALKDVKVHFMLVEDSNNSLVREKTKWKWGKISVNAKHMDKTSRKDLLHDWAKTDVNGEAIKEVRLSQFGGDKFYLAAYIEQDPHFAKYIHNHADLGTRKPVMAANEVNVWRKFWYQVTRAASHAVPKPDKSVTAYEKVFAEMLAAAETTFTEVSVPANTFYPGWMVKMGGGDTNESVIGIHNKDEFYKKFKAEKNKPVKGHLIICQHQWDAEGRYADKSYGEFISELQTRTITKNPSDEIQFTLDGAKNAGIVKPALSGNLVDLGEWSGDGKTGKLTEANILVEKSRTSLYAIRISLPSDAPDPTKKPIKVKLKLRYGRSFAGESNKHQMLITYDGSKAKFNQVVSHEFGHGFGQTPRPRRQPASSPQHPMQYDDKHGGQGSHCSTDASLYHTKDYPSGYYWNGTCVMYHAVNPKNCKQVFCATCEPYLKLQDFSEIVKP